MKAPFIETGISQLDTLLFGFKEDDNLSESEQDDKTREQLERSASILIRGGQGAGKTTLALQILNNQLKGEVKESSGTTPEKVYGLFLSLEREAEVALKNADSNLGMDSLKKVSSGKCQAGHVLGIGGVEFRERLRKQFNRHSGANWIVRVMCWVSCLAASWFLNRHADQGAGFLKSFSFWLCSLGFGLLGYIVLLLSDIHILETLSDKVYSWLSRLPKWMDNKDRDHKIEEFDNVIADALCHYFERAIKTKKAGNGKDTLWVIMDSLNVLERTIFQRTQLEKYRGAMQGLANALHQRLGMKIRVVFTGEYHAPDHDVSGASGESFFCDVELLLSQEPLVGKARTDPRNTAAAGYNIELLHDEKIHAHGAMSTQQEQQVVETRPFCRVLKSRFDKHQSRRCFYKIERGSGFVFDEVFPGDGDMLLFEDNLKQREDWEVFLLKDGPHEFPALRYELFGRTAQQRIFSTQRSFREHRRDTDLHMASLDTYWINWFRELNERSIINQELGRGFPIENQQSLEKPGVKGDSINYSIRTAITKSEGKKYDGMSEDEKKEAKSKEIYVPKETSKRFANALCRIHKIFLAQQARYKQVLNPDDRKLEDISKDDIAVLKEWLEITPGLSAEFEKLLEQCWKKFDQCNGRLLPLDWDSLLLYGEGCSDLLEELASLKYIDRRVYCRNPDKPGQDSKRVLLSVPFNANVSFLVHWEGEGTKFENNLCRRKFADRKKENEYDLAAIEKILATLLAKERKALKDFYDYIYPNESEAAKIRKWWNRLGGFLKLSKPDWCMLQKELFGKYSVSPVESEEGVGHSCNVDKEKKDCHKIAEKIFRGEPPGTLEEIFVRCRFEKREFVIETRSFDTLLCTFLEFIWGCGADLRVNCEYQFEGMDWANLMRLYQAAFLFKEMMRTGAIRKDSTLEAGAFGAKYSKKKNKKKKADDSDQHSQDGQREWLFMRQWHSTLVDILVAQKPGTHKDGKHEFLWNPDQKKGARLAIAPLPLSFWYIQRTDKKGVSSWGDWHLAVLEGSENKVLATQLVNSLMSSSKIFMRALRGASLPTVEGFYKVYAKTPCVHLNERAPEEIQLPKMTFEELRRDVFKCARSRADIFDYRHVMNEFYGFLLDLIHNPNVTNDELGEKLLNVLERISKLRDRELLIH